MLVPKQHYPSSLLQRVRLQLAARRHPVQLAIHTAFGVIVNRCRHKYGYRNIDTTLHEMSPNFGVRRFEIDSTYPIIRLFAWLRVMDSGPTPQRSHYPAAFASS